MLEPVYLAGPYRDSSSVQKIKNVMHANKVAQDFAERGIVFFSPISHTAFFDEACPKVSNKYWLNMGLIFLRQCKSIYMMHGYEKSAGAMHELRMAQEWGMDIYYEETKPGIEFKRVND